MSRGISIYFRLIRRTEDEVVYEYSGVDINKKYDKNDILAYDGIIKIKIEDLKCSDVIDSIKSGSSRILKECKYEYHHKRLMDKESGVSYPFFAIKTISKIFRTYKNSGIINNKDCVVY